MQHSLRIFVIFLLGFAVLAVYRFDEAQNLTGYPTASLTPAQDLVARGKYLATAADCMPCHTGPDHAPFSGGLVFKTPFGSIVSTNITPDKATGIGGWSDRQFYTALHEGIAPGHSWLFFPKYLYPAMPYTAYTKLSYSDVMAIKAYLNSLPPTHTSHPQNHLAFPFNQRLTLFVWRLFFFKPGPMTINPSWSQATINGAYLTLALGHCSECHTPRNFMQASIANKMFAGAPVDGLFAPNISSDASYGLGHWKPQALINYLRTGYSPEGGSAYGAMQTVIANSTSQLPPADIADMAEYLQHATTPQSTPPLPAAPDAFSSVPRGQALYASYCSACHGGNGEGIPHFSPNLANNASVIAALPNNIIGVVLNGLKNKNSPELSMPSFASRLDNQQIADISNYVRTAWKNQSKADATAVQVQRQRKNKAP